VVLQDMQAPVKSLLVEYRKENNGSLPKRLIMYRDGVSDTQFADVQHSEVSQVIAACQELAADLNQAFAPAVSVFF